MVGLVRVTLILHGFASSNVNVKLFAFCSPWAHWTSCFASLQNYERIMFFFRDDSKQSGIFNKYLFKIWHGRLSCFSSIISQAFFNSLILVLWQVAHSEVLSSSDSWTANCNSSTPELLIHPSLATRQDYQALVATLSENICNQALSTSTVLGLLMGLSALEGRLLLQHVDVRRYLPWNFSHLRHPKCIFMFRF